MGDEAKHSPGPWTFDARDVLLAADGEELALIGWAQPADKRLIAAAPEMLALLRERHRAVLGLCRQYNLAPDERCGKCDTCRIGTLLARIDGKEGGGE